MTEGANGVCVCVLCAMSEGKKVFRQRHRAGLLSFVCREFSSRRACAVQRLPQLPHLSLCRG